VGLTHVLFVRRRAAWTGKGQGVGRGEQGRPERHVETGDGPAKKFSVGRPFAMELMF
jgi:hypothetical protein